MRLFKAAFFIFQSDSKTEKCEFYQKRKSKHHFRTPSVRLLYFNHPESHRIFPFFLFRSLVLYLRMRTACVIKLYVIIYGLVSFNARRASNTLKCSKITLLKIYSYLTPCFLFIINKKSHQTACFFITQLYLQAQKYMLNNIANRFDNFKILMYN